MTGLTNAEQSELIGAIAGNPLTVGTTPRLCVAVEAILAARLAPIEALHRDLVSRLGFGDNITEPMADNDTIVRWFDEQGRDATEWREHELWRNDCYAAGHSELEDCDEHGPTCCNRRHATELRAALADPQPGASGVGSSGAGGGA